MSIRGSTSGRDNYLFLAYSPGTGATHFSYSERRDKHPIDRVHPDQHISTYIYIYMLIRT